MMPAVGRSRGAGAAAARRHGAVRREVPRSGGARAAAAEARGRAAAVRCGSSASAPPICWRSPRSSARSRCCSRPTASACATSSTCRRSSKRCGGSNAARSSRSPSIRPSPRRSPSALLFGYVANYIYDGDAPLAERRAQALSIDQAQLRELLGEAELRELLDADALAEVERQLQQLERHAAREDRGRRPRSAAAARRPDARRGRGAQPASTRRARSTTLVAGAARDRRQHRRRAAAFVPVEYAGRYRDALGVPLPSGLPESLLEPTPHAAHDLARRYARTHGPFTIARVRRALRARPRDGGSAC